MRKISIIILIFCAGLAGISVPSQRESEPDFAHLLKGEKIISPQGSYETGKSDLNTDFASFLDKLGNFLKENRGLIIEVGGHTDNSGSPATNRKLSLSRAQRVQEYLARKWGIGQDRILVKGYSSGFPIADNHTPQGRETNRRIEISALKNVNPAGKLTYIRRDVFTKLPDKIDFIRATVNQDLYHLYQVLTRKKSNANVMFQDLSKINLGPQSLMIMYSLLERGMRLPAKQNVHLSTGGLRTKLNTLKGRLQVETPSCVINPDSVEILVGIDKKKMSALSVFDGKSRVRAQGKKVDVPGGFGTTVEMGKPPAPPEPLPKAPRLIEPGESKINLPGKGDTGNVSIRFQWQRVDPENRYHLQIADDPQFEKILEDLTPADNTAELVLGSGTYYWRAAVINKRGIEGYSSQSFFTVTKGPPDLPLTIAPGIGDIIETTRRTVTVYGKTIPGTRIMMKNRQFQADRQGEFSGTVTLVTGLNHIEVRAIHPGYKTKVIWLSFYRRTFSTSAWNIGFRFDNAAKSDNLDNTYAFQVGKTFCLASRLETELALGAARLSWNDFPGRYKKEAAAVPFTAALRFMPGKGKLIPFLSTGLTTYLTFARKRGTDTIEPMFFISPEIGGGFSFAIFSTRARFEAKYTPFLKKEPFFPGTAHRIAFIFYLTDI
jgi:hypothetical protein